MTASIQMKQELGLLLFQHSQLFCIIAFAVHAILEKSFTQFSCFVVVLILFRHAIGFDIKRKIIHCPRSFSPASLVLLCLSIDMKGILSLGTQGVDYVFGSYCGCHSGWTDCIDYRKILFPELISSAGSDLWKGMSAIAGSWIGGSANQTAMREIYNVPQDLFGTMLIVDVIVANFWMAFRYTEPVKPKIDKWLKPTLRPLRHSN